MERGTIEQIQFTSSGVSSGGTGELEHELGALAGVRDVSVDPGRHTVTVLFDSTVIDQNALRSALEDGGLTLEESVAETPPASAETAGYNVGTRDDAG